MGSVLLAEERTGAYSYMLAPQRVTAGTVLRSGPSAPITVGNTLPLAAMPAGTQVSESGKVDQCGYRLVPGHSFSQGIVAGLDVHERKALCIKCA